ncbi:MAG: hypothetical protein QOE70_4366 [Chthoniobacter sp.]|jgi:lambda family phage portal protein|nr:hypothetical protein [Chthoniobacter sp.]
MKLVRATSRTGVTHTRQPDNTWTKSPGGRAVKLFDAAMQNRLTSDWMANSRLSADAELQGKLPILRSRSRDLEQNDPHAEGYLKLRENNVVGHDGFILQMKVKLTEDLDPETGAVTYDTAANTAIERVWRRFCRKENFLVTRTQQATEACKLIERTIGRDGDLLIRKVKGAPNEFGFALQLLESDYLDDQYIDFRGVACNCPAERRLPDGSRFPYCQRGMHEVRMGVELHGDWKFPVAYWLLANHPGDYFFGNNISPRRTRVPVEEMIHPFVFKRIEQTRGIPAMVASMLRLQMLGGYDEAGLVAARAGAQKMGVITKEVPEELAADFDPDALGGRTIDGSPGEFLELPMGFDIKSIDWHNPTEAYEPFTKAQKRAAAVGMGVSYSSFANDPSDANFSATRIGMLEEREGYRGGQSFFIAQILREVFPDVLESAMLRGLLDLPFSRFAEFTDEEAVCFFGRSFPWIDPVKDIQAAKEAIDLGVGTRTEFAAEAGKDFEEVTATLGREKTMRAAAGLAEDLADPAASAADPTVDDDEPLAIKSAYLGEVPLTALPDHVRATIGEFCPDADPTANVLRYQMTVPELITKADQHNLATARRRVARRTIAGAAAEVLERKGKQILLLNDRIIDGHHHLAKAEKGKITSSLPVLDLTPLRYQALSDSKKKTLNP